MDVDLSSAGLDRLSDADKRDLQQQLQTQMQKAKAQECNVFPFPPLFSTHPTAVLLAPQFTYLLPLIIAFSSAVHNLTDICWTKCITGRISGSALSSGEQRCTQNCVDRFLDANTAVLRHLQEMRGAGSMG